MRTLALLLSVTCLAAQAAAPKKTLTVAAAANLKGALEPVVQAFTTAHPEAEVQLSYGASGVFATQLANEAPYDVFLSADVKSPKALADAHLTAGPPFVYAVGKLVLWVPNSLAVVLEKEGLKTVLAPAVQKVAIGNPAVAPYGAAAEQALASAKLLEAARPKLVLGQNVGQAAQFALSGNAQAAFLPLSLALAPPLSQEGRHLLVPAASYQPLAQAGVVLGRAKEPALARAFVATLLGEEGRAILEKSGYGLPAAK